MSAIYLVTTPAGQRLIDATNRHVAINFAVKSEVTAKSVTASELSRLLKAGLKIEEVEKKPTTTPQPEIKGV